MKFKKQEPLSHNQNLKMKTSKGPLIQTLINIKAKKKQDRLKNYLRLCYISLGKTFVTIFDYMSVSFGKGMIMKFSLWFWCFFFFFSS